MANDHTLRVSFEDPWGCPLEAVCSCGEEWSARDSFYSLLIWHYRLHYQRSDHWQRLRRDLLRAARWMCEHCGARASLDAAHRTYERKGQERLSDLVALCRPCHDRMDGRSDGPDTLKEPA